MSNNAGDADRDNRDDSSILEPNVARLDQPEDEATEHALRLMSEALRQDAGRRWLVSENP